MKTWWCTVVKDRNDGKLNVYTDGGCTRYSNSIDKLPLQIPPGDVRVQIVGLDDGGRNHSCICLSIGGATLPDSEIESRKFEDVGTYPTNEVYEIVRTYLRMLP
jgi:hypothetical protein